MSNEPNLQENKLDEPYISFSQTQRDYLQVFYLEYIYENMSKILMLLNKDEFVNLRRLYVFKENFYQNFIQGLKYFYNYIVSLENKTRIALAMGVFNSFNGVLLNVLYDKSYKDYIEIVLNIDNKNIKDKERKEVFTSYVNKEDLAVIKLIKDSLDKNGELLPILDKSYFEIVFANLTNIFGPILREEKAKIEKALKDEANKNEEFERTRLQFTLKQNEFKVYTDQLITDLKDIVKTIKLI